MISELKDRVKSMQEDNQEDEEAFKTKMAHLHQADLQSMKSYYENQMAILQQDLENREMSIRECR